MADINIHEICKRGEMREVERYLEAGGDIEKRDGGGRTPLSHACRYGQTEVASLLIEKGASLESRDKGGRTCLHLACFHGDPAVISLLLERGRGVDLETRDKEGRTPEDLLCRGLGTKEKKSDCLAVLEAFKKKPSSNGAPDAPSREESRHLVSSTLALAAPPPPIPITNLRDVQKEILELREKHSQELEAKDLEISSLKSAMIAKDTEISSLHRRLRYCEAENRELSLEKNSLEARVELLIAELNRFKINEKILTSSHVRISSDCKTRSSDRIVEGVFHSGSSRSDQMCKLKLVCGTEMMSNVESLKKELQVLMHLQNSPTGNSNQFIVRCLSQELVSSSSSSSVSNLLDSSSSLNHHSHTPILTTANPLSLSSLTSDSNQFSVPVNPMIGLVLEYGGPNLKEFVDKNHSRLDTIYRVHIVRDVVNALGFLHDHDIVHGDLKPENIVSFSFLGEGMVRWKLVDLEHSHYFRAHPPPNVSASSLCFDLGCTPEYSAPEMLRVLGEGGTASGESLLVSPQLDIWSLGMVSVYTMKGCTMLRLLYPDRNFSRAMVCQMVREWDDGRLKHLLSFFGEKEKTFLECCLKSRLSCRELLGKSLFGTGNSTLQGSVIRMMSAELNRKFESLREFVSELMESSKETMSSDMNELLLEVVRKLEGRER